MRERGIYIYIRHMADLKIHNLMPTASALRNDRAPSMDRTTAAVASALQQRYAMPNQDTPPPASCYVYAYLLMMLYELAVVRCIPRRRREDSCDHGLSSRRLESKSDFVTNKSYDKPTIRRHS